MATSFWMKLYCLCRSAHACIRGVVISLIIAVVISLITALRGVVVEGVVVA